MDDLEWLAISLALGLLALVYAWLLGKGDEERGA